MLAQSEFMKSARGVVAFAAVALVATAVTPLHAQAEDDFELFGGGDGGAITAEDQPQGEATPLPVDPAAAEPTPEVVAGRGVIEGNVFDRESGDPISNVTVIVDENPELLARTDDAGYYRIEGIPAGLRVLEMSKGNYQPVKIPNFPVNSNETATGDFAMRPIPADVDENTFTFETETIEYDQLVSLNAQLLDLKQQQVEVTEFLGSDDFSRLGLSDVADAIKRVSGVSVSGGKYAVIRGLDDRFSVVTLNGLALSSPDPDREAVPLDIFPTGLFEQIGVTKTFYPDQQGQASGGTINLKTKSFPDERILKFKAGYGFQDIAKQDYFLQGDRYGEDDFAQGGQLSQRDISGAAFPNAAVPRNINFLTARNSFDSSNGVTTSGDPAFDKSYSFEYGETFTFDKFEDMRLGVVMGMNWGKKYRSQTTESLRNAPTSDLRNDNGVRTVDNQKTTYESSEEIAWSGVAGLTFSPNDDHEMGYNFIFTRTGENTIGSEVGVGSISARSTYVDNLLASGDPTLLRTFSGFSSYEERSLAAHQIYGKHVIEDWGGLEMDWGFSVNRNEQFEPNNFSFVDAALAPAHTPISNNATLLRRIGGTGNDSNVDRYAVRNNSATANALTIQTGSTSKANVLPLTFERFTRQDSRNFRTDFSFPFKLSKAESKLKWGFFDEYARRRVTQNERSFGSGTVSSFVIADDGAIYETANSDASNIVLADGTILGPKSRPGGQLNTDYTVTGQSVRKSDGTGPTFDLSNRTGNLTLPNGTVITPSDPLPAVLPTGTTIDPINNPAQTETRSVFNTNGTAIGERDIQALYTYLEFKPVDSVTIVGGARVEETKLSYTGGFTISSNPSLANIGVVEERPIDQLDVLPSLAMVVDLTDQVKLRLAGSKTIARPSFKELAPFPVIDPNDQSLLIGNPGVMTTGAQNILPNRYAGLEMAEIYNFDARVEYYDDADFLALGFFAKRVHGAIEETTVAGNFGISDVRTYINNENPANILGVEFEMRKNLGFLGDDTFMEWFNVGFNATAINATVERSDYEINQYTSPGGVESFGSEPTAAQLQQLDNLGLQRERPLFNQPDYLANAFFNIAQPDTGTDVTLSYNYEGKKLIAVGDRQIPDRYLNPVGTLNVVVSQKLGDHVKVSFAAKNLLDPWYVVDFDGAYNAANAAATVPGGISDDAAFINTVESQIDPDTYYDRYKKGISYSISVTASW